jgi:hypothetical protein
MKKQLKEMIDGKDKRNSTGKMHSLLSTKSIPIGYK